MFWEFMCTISNMTIVLLLNIIKPNLQWSVIYFSHLELSHWSDNYLINTIAVLLFGCVIGGLREMNQEPNPCLQEKVRFKKLCSLYHHHLNLAFKLNFYFHPTPQSWWIHGSLNVTFFSTIMEDVQIIMQETESYKCFWYKCSSPPPVFKTKSFEC